MSGSSTGRAQSVVRRLIVFVLLYTLVIIAAIGLSGLIERILGASRVIAAGDAGLARSLAFALVGVPLAGLLWWWQRRRLADPAERASLWWALYLTAMSLTALITATVSLATLATAAIDGEWRPGALATALVWAVVWIWHRWMRVSPATAPTRLVALPVELAALYGLAVAVAGAIGALGSLLVEALAQVATVLVSSQHWLVPVLQALVWCAIGALVWWWHWFRERAKSAPDVFAAVLLVIVIAAAAAITLFSIGTMLFVLLRVLFDTGTVAEALAPLDEAIAGGLIGAVVWVYHGLVLTVRSEPTRRAARLAVSAVALIGAASGLGVIVNALLATFVQTLVDDDPRTLLLGGISALVVGVPAWRLAWRPHRSTTADAADPARRVYLVAVFGASAVIALVTLLLIGFRVFEFLLGSSGGVVERIRAPLGLLTATVVVFGYHFAVWRRDRATAPKAAGRRIGRIILVVAGDGGGPAEQLRAATGAVVTVWPAADAAATLGESDLAALLESLSDLSAPRVLVVAEPGGGAKVTPLAE